MSSRTKYTALTLLGTECTSSWQIFTSVLFNSWRTTSLNALVFNGEFGSARLYLQNPHSCSRVLRLREIHVHWRIFTLGELISSLSCWKNAQYCREWEEGSIFRFKFLYSITYSNVWNHDRVVKAEHFGCFWIRNGWLGLLKPEYGLPEASILYIRALEDVIWVYFALATVCNSGGDNNHACHFCRLRHTLWD